MRKEVRHALKHDIETTTETDAPPGDDDPAKVISTDEETKAIRERIISIRRKIHKATVQAVQARWNYEEGVSGVRELAASPVYKSSYFLENLHIIHNSNFPHYCLQCTSLH